MLEYLDDPRTDDPEHGFVLTEHRALIPIKLMSHVTVMIPNRDVEVA